MKHLYSIFFFFFLCSSLGHSQTPKREMRATWLATVWALDWPKDFSTNNSVHKISKTGNQKEIDTQKRLMIEMLDKLQEANFNSVYFQVRGRCDAMYKSSYEPWSSDLVVTRGMDPGYDPLEFVIEEAHKRGMELHAWLNPYRFATTSTYWDGEAGDYRKTNPDWILTYEPYINSEGKWVYYAIMDPAVPEVRQRITDIVKEIVTNYDVDGIAFDDYFYAYGGTTPELDSISQRKYNTDSLAIGDWRRQNVNKMVASVYNAIQETKPYVTFGVSPFGIWTTNNNVAQKEGIVLPTGISGSDMYEKIYCDPVAWLKEGTVDYISPQLYWPMDQVGQEYDILCPWWSDLSFRYKTHFYSSHSVSDVQPSDYSRSLKDQWLGLGNEDVALETLTGLERAILMQDSRVEEIQTRAFGPGEIGDQVNCNRKSSRDGAPGSVFYSTKNICSVKGVIPYLKNYCFVEKALIPVVDWKKAPEVSAVSSISLVGNTLQWNSNNTNVRYTIYAVPDSKLNEPDAFSSSRYLLGVSYVNSYAIPESVDRDAVTFAVAVLDRYGNEYTPVLMGKELEEGKSVTLTYPANGEDLLAPFNFKWEEVGADWYTVQIAEDKDFAIFHSAKDVVANELFTTQIAHFQSGKTYYWRVISHQAGQKDAISQSFQFIPRIFSIQSPVLGDQEVELEPTVSWNDFGIPTMKYEVIIASAFTFADQVIVLSEAVIGENSLKIPTATLLPVTTYYMKIKTILEGKEVETEVVNFTTKMVYPSVPVIISPVNEELLSGGSVIIKWQDEIYAPGFQAHLSKEPNFPVRGTTSRTSSAFNYEADFGNLATGTYYARVRSKYNGGQTEWSDTIKFDWAGPTSIIENLSVEKISVYGTGANQTLKVNSGADKGNLSASIFDLVGNERKIVCRNYSVDGQATFSLDLTNLPKGVYLLRVMLNDQVRTLKLLN